MKIYNKEYIRQFLTNNPVMSKDINGKPVKEFKQVPYRWTHGATDYHLGDGHLVHSIIVAMRYKSLCCLGSGGGFIPRIMTQARLDLHDTEIFDGNKDINYGDIGITYLVDACNGIGGKVDYEEPHSFFRYQFIPKFIKETTKNAYYNYFIKKDIKIDFLYIDAGHSYEDVKQDFELYSKILNPKGMIAIHDTDERYQKEMVITEDEKEYYEFFDGPPKFIKELGPEWKTFDFFNTGIHPSKPQSTGLTLVQRA